MKNLFIFAAAVIMLLVVAKAIEIVEAFGNRAQPSTTVSARPAPGRAGDPSTMPAEAGVVSLDRNFYVVIDGSGSMTDRGCAGQFPTRLEGAKWAVKQFTEHNVPSDVNLGLYVFDRSGSRELVPLGKDNRRGIVAAIDRVSGGGNTPLNAAIKAAVSQLATQRERQLGYGEFYIVVATDGEATDGDLSVGGVREALQQGIPIITIGFCLPGGHPLTSGSISYRNANSPEELLSALRETQGESPYFDQTVFRRN